MEYPYPREFPQESRDQVLAQVLRGARKFESDKQRAGSSVLAHLLEYILSVFITFVREAAELVRHGVWTTDRMNSESREFLRQFAIKARHEKGYDRSGYRLEELVSNWDGSLLPDARRAFEQFPQWQEFQDILLELAETRARVRDGGTEVLHWEDVEISLISDERVQVKCGTQPQTYNYAEMGCEDKRSGKPSQVWILLRTLAKAGGTIPLEARDSTEFVRVEKRIQRLRQALKHQFGIAGDPIRFDSQRGYQCQFKIGCSPSFET